MKFADIHCHILFGVDDGADSEQKMYDMADASYRDGVRVLCVTPHFHLGYFGNNQEASSESYRLLKEYTQEHYPDLKVCIGNELRYSQASVTWLREGMCRTMNGTRYLLVDFREDEDSKVIISAMNSLLNAGYRPILAHAERYRKFHWDLREINELKDNGIVIQIDAQSVFRGFGLGCQQICKKILAYHLADVVSSDAHGLHQRPPGICGCYQFVKKKYGADYADEICYKNAARLLGLTSGRKDKN